MAGIEQYVSIEMSPHIGAGEYQMRGWSEEGKQSVRAGWLDLGEFTEKDMTDLFEWLPDFEKIEVWIGEGSFQDPEDARSFIANLKLLTLFDTIYPMFNLMPPSAIFRRSK